MDKKLMKLCLEIYCGFGHSELKKLEREEMLKMPIKEEETNANNNR